MGQKYTKPAPNYTGALLVLTVVATGAAMVFGLPAGWVAFAGVLITAWCHPAPVLTGPKDTPATTREEILVFQSGGGSVLRAGQHRRRREAGRDAQGRRQPATEV